jgi:hypothetical protein
MPVRLCAQRPCAKPATWRGRCPTHAPTLIRETRSANRPLYNRKRWRTTRRAQLARQPLCETCGQIATDVHHRQDIQAGGDPWDPANLASLCHPCHSRITRRTQADGAPQAQGA